MTVHGSHPTWYDVLGVPRDASPEEIKAAWRQATDAFEPGSGAGHFRTFNDAADVLLDPDRRAAYDEGLGTSQADRAPAHPEPLVPPPSTDAGATDAGTADAGAADAGTTDAGDPDAPAGRGRDALATRRAGLIAGLLALLTVGVVVVAVLLGLRVRENAQVAEAGDRAPAAAERAAEAVLAYDYRRLAEDRARASRYLTEDFEEKYLENFALLEKQKDGTPGAAVQTKTVVKSTVLGSGVMDARANRVRVLVYVNQVSERPDRDPQIFQNRVTMEMQREGDRWLVDDLRSY